MNAHERSWGFKHVNFRVFLQLISLLHIIISYISSNKTERYIFDYQTINIYLYIQNCILIKKNSISLK